jgi:DNA polymerase I
MINIEAEGNIIHLWGRKQNGELYHQTVNDFFPYFYVEDSKGQFTTLFGKKVRKFYCSHPAEVREKREEYKPNYEADVTFVNRYLIDKVEVLEKEPIRAGFLDIEILGSEGPFPSVIETKFAITCITIFDVFEKKYYTFIWHPEYKESVMLTDDEHILNTFTTEREMLRTLIAFIRKKDFDMLIAWNGERFDFPYLYNRCEALGLETFLLGRLAGSRFLQLTNGMMITKIRGRTLFDLLWAYKYLIFASRESFSLDYVGYYELKMQKLKLEKSVDWLWENEPKKLIEYNIRDVMIMVKLDEKLKLIDFFDAIRREAKVLFEDVFMRSRVTDFIILDYCKKRNLVLPTKEKLAIKQESFEGGYVIEPIAGKHNNVFVFDLKSLYPSIIISCNMSPETIRMDKSGDIKLGNDVSFMSEPRGVIPSVMLNLLETRKLVKSMMSKTEYGTSEYYRLYLSQFSLKVLVNSLYGALSTPYFRLYRKEISATTTYLGRLILKWTKTFLEKNNCIVVAGDTDSVLFTIHNTQNMAVSRLAEKGFELTTLINKSYKEFSDMLGIQNPEFKIEFEKIYSKVLFAKSESEASVKKRRAGKICWLDGNVVDDIEIVGFEARRSDVPEVTRIMQREMFKMILEDKDKREIMKYISETVKKIKTLPIEDIAIPVGISKSVMDYGDFFGKKIPIHIKAVKHSNKYHHLDLKEGEKIKYVYVTRSPKGVPKTSVVAMRDRMPEGYTINYDKMVERTITKKIFATFHCLGWNVEEINGQQRLFKEVIK